MQCVSQWCLVLTGFWMYYKDSQNTSLHSDFPQGFQFVFFVVLKFICAEVGSKRQIYAVLKTDF